MSKVLSAIYKLAFAYFDDINWQSVETSQGLWLCVCAPIPQPISLPPNGPKNLRKVNVQNLASVQSWSKLCWDYSGWQSFLVVLNQFCRDSSWVLLLRNSDLPINKQVTAIHIRGIALTEFWRFRFSLDSHKYSCTENRHISKNAIKMNPTEGKQIYKYVLPSMYNMLRVKRQV